MDLQAMLMMFHDVSFEVVRSTSRAHFHMKSRLETNLEVEALRLIKSASNAGSLGCCWLRWRVCCEGWKPS